MSETSPPPATARLLAKARHEWEGRDFDAARRSLESVLAMAPGDPKAVRMLGMVARSQGDYARAVDCCQQVLGVWPGDPFLRSELGLALVALGEVEAATPHFRRACELAPDSGTMWFNLGETLWRQAQGDEAIAALLRAVALEPGHIEARLSLARAQAGMGHIEKAVAEWREVLSRDPVNADAWYGLSMTLAFDAMDAASLRHAFARQALPDRARCMLGFALAKALEDQGDFADAFDVLRQANALQRTSTKAGWDTSAERGWVDAILATPTRAAPSMPGVDAGGQVIFVTGMPRSGTTLVEQILASHTGVESGNEIKHLPQLIDEESRRRGVAYPAWLGGATAEDWQRLGREYLARTERWRAHKPRFTDKNLLNWHFLDAALAMLPAARVIIVQRDPVETCLACYRHGFTDEAGFATDLDDLADYCNGFTRLAGHWLRKYPARVLGLNYEALVADPETVIRGVLDFCGLPFEPACLTPHKTSRAVLTPSAAQVRRPLQRGMARAALYGDKLDRLRRKLHDGNASVSGT